MSSQKYDSLWEQIDYQQAGTVCLEDLDVLIKLVVWTNLPCGLNKLTRMLESLPPLLLRESQEEAAVSVALIESNYTLIEDLKSGSVLMKDVTCCLPEMINKFKQRDDYR